MKYLIYIATLLLTTFHGYSQDNKVEKIDWNSLPGYSAKSIEFTSEAIQFKCSNCKFVEIKTESGLTGIFIIGNGTIHVETGDISDSVSACLIRMSPKMKDAFMSIEYRTNIDDKGFIALAKNILNDSFSHCYHSDLNAIIPSPTDFAFNFFGNKYGEVLASYSTSETVVFSFSERKMLAKSGSEGSGK